MWLTTGSLFLAIISHMTITNLKQIRGTRCPHALAFMGGTDKPLAIGCPMCGYKLDDADEITELTTAKAELKQSTVGDYLKASTA